MMFNLMQLHDYMFCLTKKKKFKNMPLLNYSFSEIINITFRSKFNVSFTILILEILLLNYLFSWKYNYLSIKWEVLKKISTLKSFPVGLTYSYFVFTAFKYFCFINKFQSSSNKISFSCDENFTINFINVNSFIGMSIL